MPQNPMHPGDPTSFTSNTTASAEPRQLLLAAMARVAGVKGYAEATVADVLVESGISAQVFGRHFKGKRDCFLAAYEAVTDGLRAEILSECDARQPWALRMRTGLTGIVDRFAADPALARVVTVEAAVAGADALRIYFETISRFGEFVGAGRDSDTELPEQIALMAVGGVAGLISAEVAAGRVEELRDLLPSLLYALLLPYLGPDAATVQMRLAAGLH